MTFQNTSTVQIVESLFRTAADPTSKSNARDGSSRRTSSSRLREECVCFPLACNTLLEMNIRWYCGEGQCMLDWLVGDYQFLQTVPYHQFMLSVPRLSLEDSVSSNSPITSCPPNTREGTPLYVGRYQTQEQMPFSGAILLECLY